MLTFIPTPIGNPQDITIRAMKLFEKAEMSIDICNECHPFFTGSEKILDAAGRVEKFKSKYKLG